jgi:[acyl-carrier-protein] S-malonyltransferase
MKDAADKLAEAFNNITFNTPEIPVVNNVDVVAETDVEAIKLALIKQLYSPVRWTETIELLAKNGVSLVVEAGPGKVLLGLIKRIDKTITSVSVNDQASLTEALETIR